MDVTMDAILEILEDVRPDVDFVNEKKLIDDKILDSFDIISIVSEFNETFDVAIKAEKLKAENFNTVEAMEELISKLQEEG